MRPIACALQLAAGGTALLASAPSHAVHVNPSGLGQVLLYPYYTVRGNHVTALSVTNTQENHKLLKVRFLEGKNSREVMDLHLFLGPLDTWTAGVVATPDGARLISGDNSCVTPADLFTETRTTAGGAAINAFRTSDFTGTRTDSEVFRASDRTREGFFEVIEMGVIDNDNVEGNALTGAAANLVNPLTPGSNGVPADCAALAAYEVAAGNNAPIQFPNTGATLLSPPRGGLMGRASLIQSLTGTNFTYDATALDGWSNRVAYGALASGRPQLADAYPATSLVLTSAGVVGSVWPDTAGGQRDAVSAPLMRASIANEFILDAGTASQTDWILAHPTKRYYVATASGAGASPAIAPFAVNFSSGTNGYYGSCDPYGFGLADRDPRPPPAIIFYQCGVLCPPAAPPRFFCVLGRQRGSFSVEHAHRVNQRQPVDCRPTNHCQRFHNYPVVCNDPQPQECSKWAQRQVRDAVQCGSPSTARCAVSALRGGWPGSGLAGDSHRLAGARIHAAYLSKSRCDHALWRLAAACLDPQCPMTR
jgi:hypothetical protein